MTASSAPAARIETAEPVAALLARASAALDAGDHVNGLQAAVDARALADGHGAAAAALLEAKHLWRLGRFEDAASAARDAAAASRQLDDAAGECDALCTLAIAYSELGAHELALQRANDALELARSHGLAALAGHAQGRIGICHERLGDPAQGERHLLAALAQARELDDIDDTLRALNNLAATALGGWHLFRRRGENACALESLARAQDYARQALELSASLADHYRHAVVQGNLGEILIHSGDYEESERLLEAALAQARAGALHAVELRTRHNLAALHLARGEAPRAFEELTALLDDVRRSGDHEATRMRVHAALWQAAKALGRFETALAHCEAYHEMEMQRLALQGQAQARLAARRADDAPQPAPADAGAPSADDPRIEREIAPLLEQLRLRRKPLALAALEFDGFAALAARMGPVAADAVLRELGGLMRQRLRGRDLALRRGAASFVIVLGDTPPAAAQAICERLRIAVQHHDWSHFGVRQALTVSIGLVNALAGSTPGAEMQRVSATLQGARAAGGNRVLLGPGA